MAPKHCCMLKFECFACFVTTFAIFVAIVAIAATAIIGAPSRVSDNTAEAIATFIEVIPTTRVAITSSANHITIAIIVIIIRPGAVFAPLRWSWVVAFAESSSCSPSTRLATRAPGSPAAPMAMITAWNTIFIRKQV